MVTLTRVMHVLSGCILIITGAYVHAVFGEILATEILVLLWSLCVLYLGGQLEKQYRVVTKLLILLYK